MLLSRDDYITALMKLAGAEQPDYHVDNAAVARAEHTSNMADTRGILKGLFTQAGPSETANTKMMDAALPHKSVMDRETSNPLLKVAFFTKVSSRLDEIPNSISRARLSSFLCELQKIAVNQVGGMLRALGKAPSAMGQVASTIAKPGMAAANKSLSNFKSLASNPTAMPTMPGMR